MAHIKRIDEMASMDGANHSLPAKHPSADGWYWNGSVYYTARKYDENGNIIEDNCRDTVNRAKLIYNEMRLAHGQTKCILEVTKSGKVTELAKVTFE